MLKFIQINDTGKTKVWAVGTQYAELGQVKWYAPWRRYTFYPNANTLFDCTCLKEVIDFISSEMLKRI